MNVMAKRLVFSTLYILVHVVLGEKYEFMCLQFICFKSISHNTYTSNGILMSNRNMMCIDRQIFISLMGFTNFALFKINRTMSNKKFHDGHG